MSRQRVFPKSTGNRQTKKEQEVLSVASDYFLNHGYQGTSINAMARDSGISKESIYRYFSGKKELFEAVIAKELTNYQEKLHSLDIKFDSISLEIALRKTAESILDAVTTDRTLGLRRLIFQETQVVPDIGRYYYEIGPQEAYRNLEHIFEFHKSKFNLEPAKLSNYFVAMVLHKTMLLRQCGVVGPFTKKQIQKRAAEATKDFIGAFVN